MRRLLALVLSATMLSAFVLPASAPPPVNVTKMSFVGASELPATPGEPRDPQRSKCAAALLSVVLDLARIDTTGVVASSDDGVGPGELHRRIVDRPPIAALVLS